MLPRPASAQQVRDAAGSSVGGRPAPRGFKVASQGAVFSSPRLQRDALRGRPEPRRPGGTGVCRDRPSGIGTRRAPFFAELGKSGAPRRPSPAAADRCGRPRRQGGRGGAGPGQAAAARRGRRPRRGGGSLPLGAPPPPARRHGRGAGQRPQVRLAPRRSPAARPAPRRPAPPPQRGGKGGPGGLRVRAGPARSPPWPGAPGTPEPRVAAPSPIRWRR